MTSDIVNQNWLYNREDFYFKLRHEGDLKYTQLNDVFNLGKRFCGSCAPFFSFEILLFVRGRVHIFDIT